VARSNGPFGLMFSIFPSGPLLSRFRAERHFLYKSPD
jgi:hypothetical protein